MEYGIQFFPLECDRLREAAHAAEELGFDLIMLPDHVVYEGPEGQLDPNVLAYDPMILAAVVCQATHRVRVGHLVLCNLFRHPVMTAMSLTTLDRMSGGRLIAGLGTGWTETEFKMTGIPFPDIGTRLRMLDEALHCIRSLWTEEKTTFDGEFYRFEQAILSPKPVQQTPPILLGGSGKGLLRLAGRHADYVNIISEVGSTGKITFENIRKMTDDAFRAKVQFVRDEAARRGRDPKSVKISNFLFNLVFTDSPEMTRNVAEGMAPVFRQTAEGILQSPLALIGTPEECVRELRRRRDQWGVEQFIFSVPDANLDTMRKLSEQVLGNV
jgi:probable F420-dependent oxidoreductase